MSENSHGDLLRHHADGVRGGDLTAAPAPAKCARWDFVLAAMCFALALEGVYGADKFGGWWAVAYGSCAVSFGVLGGLFARSGAT